VFCDESYSASPHDLALFVMTCNCNSQTTQYQKNKIEKDNLKKIITKKTMRRNTVAIHNVLWAKLQYFPHMIKLYYKVKILTNSILKKIKWTKMILKKNIIKKENTKETGKKLCEEKLYQSIVFF